MFFMVKAPCTPICDSCRHYDFNADEDGAYVNDGRCNHPDHPGRSEPHMSCGDFDCRVCDEKTGD